MDVGARPLVLLCDDEAGPRVAMACMLGNVCEIVAASTAEDALTECRSRRFDVAVVDWTIPSPSREASAAGPDGWLVDALRQADPHLSVIVWSAHGSRIEASALALGAHAMLGKPIAPDVVKQFVFAAAAATRSRRFGPAHERAGSVRPT
jgi:CheY-like chemotaxis protein